MERPGLQRLLADIAAGKIDIVVVYKIDRLTRSLADFARIVETFEAAGTSFVSVTQSFNTTTSMGRLMLNVLLSFAQFEREVTPHPRSSRSSGSSSNLISRPSARWTSSAWHGEPFTAGMTVTLKADRKH